MANWSRVLFLSALMVGSVGCDQATKAMANATIGGGPSRSYLGDTIRLTYAENPGGFLSLGAELPPAVRNVVFGVAPAAVIVVLLVPLIRNPSLRRIEVIALGLIVSGAVGNLIDRLAFGAVRDFLNVGIGPLRTGIFNLADLAVTVGVVSLCVLAATTNIGGEAERRDQEETGGGPRSVSGHLDA